MKKLISLFFLFSTITFSQTDLLNSELSEIVVSANKYQTLLHNTASSVSVITSVDIKLNQFNSVVDILRTVPGVSLTQQGGPGKLSSLFMRGAGSNFVLVLIDNIEVNDPSSSNNGFDFSSLQVSEIEKIEIVRGPQSTLYGSEAAAGVINIITKTGNGEPSFSILGEGGSNNYYKGSLSANGEISGLNYHANFSRLQTDGISVIKGENFEDDGFENNSGFLKLGYNISDNLELNFSYKYLNTATDLDQSSQNGDDPNFISDLETQLFNFTSRASLLDGKWETSLRGSYFQSVTKTNDKVDAINLNTSSNSNYDGNRTSFNWQNNFRLIDNNIISLGVDTKRDQANSNYHSESIYGPFDSNFPEESITTTGIYLQDLFTYENFNAALGYRYDNNEKFGSVSTYRIAPMYFVESTGTKIKATYGTGFKAPSLFNLFAPYYGNIDLKPEKSKGWDIGIEQFLFGNNLLLGITYFDMKFEDMLGFDEFFKSININEAETKGIEALLQLNSFKGLTFNASYTYNEANDLSIPELKNEQLIRRPKHQFSVNSNYSFDNQLTVGLSVKHSGERFDNNFATFPASRVPLKAYTLMNMMVSYKAAEFIRVFGRVENLLDEDYEEVLFYGALGRSAYLGFEVNL